MFPEHTDLNPRAVASHSQPVLNLKQEKSTPDANLSKLTKELLENEPLAFGESSMIEDIWSDSDSDQDAESDFEAIQSSGNDIPYLEMTAMDKAALDIYNNNESGHSMMSDLPGKFSARRTSSQLTQLESLYQALLERNGHLTRRNECLLQEREENTRRLQQLEHELYHQYDVLKNLRA